MSHFRVLVTGSSGQLGSELKLLANSIIPDGVFFFTDFKELDVTNFQHIKEYVETNKVTVIINCAAYTAVDKAESEQEKAYLVNALAPQYLAKAAKEFNCRLIHISTDYVFDGQNYKPYVETDIPNPKSVYGKTKLEGERFIKKVNPENSIIIRTSWVYSRFGHNFVKTIVKLLKERKEIKVVNDQFGTPTNAGDLAMLILNIIPQLKNNSPEIFHYSNEGACSWYDFAHSISEIFNLKCEIIPVQSSEFNSVAPRPNFSVLSKNLINERFNVNIKHWRDSLHQMKNNF